ncbi:MAG: YifB family Mg chelatase-like AAA ATPase [Campylobacteraceae bacterium]|jgi:magnesium chelatase family protein|nr:YifB family Mg chelatase-like AAA ATPase [Campylobacteraceae bacterium]MBT4030295.1 YifB family Mg chelatase-like AAA ATPase [Campylobacteraceae bacterium]MBT4179637.1 YifB family Mg chelatase-like AAA ATPase [Campylobacteraceae bacterium]MBT4572972.1 YifB family Mg chelatase-like AAA ATPase [Campylobacteraceae bacterium]MBT4707337.1 YifB family Mg chelatase-like AAA ATPase [Campylobacteraceae bacterium]
MKQLKCASIDGFEAISVDVESTFTNGLPSFTIVGLGNSAIQESKDRIKSALLSNDYKFPPKKITINLSPSEIAKTGSQFDLSIALSIALQESKVNFKDFFVFGELGLDGTLKDTKSIFVLILSLAKQGLLKNILIPKESIHKISMIPNINIYAVENLNEAIEFFSFDYKDKYKIKNHNFNFESLSINNINYYFSQNFELDFTDIKGQNIAKRAALISAAGNHNIIFEGSPGCGKSMICKRLQYIMHPMSLDEILEKAKLDSLQVKEPNFIPIRNLISPHHSSTKASIIGGTKIGEVSLSNGGLLFFDEIPHFSKSIIEAMREPLEDYTILVSRVNTKVKYETKFLFASAMNPCPCGNLLAKTKNCRCSDIEIQRYKNRLSDPFLDRIDIYVTMSEISKEDKADVSSSELHNKVLKAFKQQMNRGQNELNGKLNDKDIKKYCVLQNDANEILDKAISNYTLSFRAINKVLKLSRTIADLEEVDLIQTSHILEALSYRKR